MSTLLVVTGASRGFGRSLLLQFAANIAGPLVVVATGRNAEGLKDSAALLAKTAPAAAVVRSVFDMADLDSIESAWLQSIAAAKAAAGAGGFHRAILINNSGSLGDTCYISDLPFLSSLRQAVDSNVTATMWYTSLFLRWLQSPDGPSAAAASPAAPSVIINVSSLAAIKGFATQLVYCVGKAARDMLHAGLAEELALAAEAGKLRVKVKTLNYAPGPLDTDMQGELRESNTLFGPTKDFFLQMKAQNTIIQPDVSAAKCVQIVAEDKYASGAHVDYYDPMPA